MRRLRLRSAAAAFALLLLLLATPAAAGLGGGNLEIGIASGFVHFDDEVSDDTTARYSGRIGYFFTDLFQVEAQMASMDTDEDGVDSELDTVFLNGVFNFHPREDVVPYALVGVGKADLEFDNGVTVVDDDSGAAQIGLGVRFLFGRNQRASGRFEASMLVEDAFDESSAHESFTFGIGWRIGR